MPVRQSQRASRVAAAAAAREPYYLRDRPGTRYRTVSREELQPSLDVQEPTGALVAVEEDQERSDGVERDGGGTEQEEDDDDDDREAEGLVEALVDGRQAAEATYSQASDLHAPDDSAIHSDHDALLAADGIPRHAPEDVLALGSSTLASAIVAPGASLQPLNSCHSLDTPPQTAASCAMDIVLPSPDPEMPAITPHGPPIQVGSHPIISGTTSAALAAAPSGDPPPSTSSVPSGTTSYAPLAATSSRNVSMTDVPAPFMQPRTNTQAERRNRMLVAAMRRMQGLPPVTDVDETDVPLPPSEPGSNDPNGEIDSGESDEEIESADESGEAIQTPNIGRVPSNVPDLTHVPVPAAPGDEDAPFHDIFIVLLTEDVSRISDDSRITVREIKTAARVERTVCDIDETDETGVSLTVPVAMLWPHILEHYPLTWTSFLRHDIWAPRVLGTVRESNGHEHGGWHICSVQTLFPTPSSQNYPPSPPPAKTLVTTVMRTDPRFMIWCAKRTLPRDSTWLVVLSVELVWASPSPFGLPSVHKWSQLKPDTPATRTDDADLGSDVFDIDLDDAADDIDLDDDAGDIDLDDDAGDIQEIEQARFEGHSNQRRAASAARPPVRLPPAIEEPSAASRGAWSGSNVVNGRHTTLGSGHASLTPPLTSNAAPLSHNPTLAPADVGPEQSIVNAVDVLEATSVVRALISQSMRSSLGNPSGDALYQDACGSEAHRANYRTTPALALYHRWVATQRILEALNLTLTSSAGPGFRVGNHVLSRDDVLQVLYWKPKTFAHHTTIWDTLERVRPLVADGSITIVNNVQLVQFLPWLDRSAAKPDPLDVAWKWRLRGLEDALKDISSLEQEKSKFSKERRSAAAKKSQKKQASRLPPVGGWTNDDAGPSTAGA